MSISMTNSVPEGMASKRVEDVDAVCRAGLHELDNTTKVEGGIPWMMGEEVLNWALQG